MAEILLNILQYLLKVLGATGVQLVVLLGPGLLLALLINLLSDATRTLAARLFGFNFFIYFTAPGTMIHELGHAILALLFGHKIDDMKIFAPDPNNGTLGYVSHSYNPRNIYQTIGNFFIGIGPILFGSLVIYFTARWTVGTAVFAPLQSIQVSTDAFSSLHTVWLLLVEVFRQAFAVLKGIFSPANFKNGWFYLFIYVVFAIGSHVKLSLEDLKGAATGFYYLVALVFVINLATLWISDFASRAALYLSRAFSFVYAYLFFTIILILIFMVVMGVLVLLKRVIIRR